MITMSAIRVRSARSDDIARDSSNSAGFAGSGPAGRNSKLSIGVRSNAACSNFARSDPEALMAVTKLDKP